MAYAVYLRTDYFDLDVDRVFISIPLSPPSTCKTDAVTAVVVYKKRGCVKLASRPHRSSTPTYSDQAPGPAPPPRIPRRARGYEIVRRTEQRSPAHVVQPSRWPAGLLESGVCGYATPTRLRQGVDVGISPSRPPRTHTIQSSSICA